MSSDMGSVPHLKNCEIESNTLANYMLVWPTACVQPMGYA